MDGERDRARFLVMHRDERVGAGRIEAFAHARGGTCARGAAGGRGGLLRAT